MFKIVNHIQKYYKNRTKQVQRRKNLAEPCQGIFEELTDEVILRVPRFVIKQ